MLVGAASFQHAPPAETVPLSRSQVCIRKLSSSYNCEVCLCRFIGVAVDPFARLTYKAPFLSRAEISTHRRQAQSASSSQRSIHKGTHRHDLQSLKEALKHDALQSYNERPSQDLQILEGFLHQHADAQPNGDVGSEQQRLPRAVTVQDCPARNRQDAQSSAASFGSPQPGNINRNRDARPSKRRGSRVPARGLDVLDKLMASHGRSSRALLDSLQSTLASNDDGAPHAHFHEKDTCASTSFSGKISRNETVEGTRGSMSQMLSNFRKIDTWKPTYDIMTDNAATSSTFASSIEKALSPSTAPKTTSTTRSTLASSTNGRVSEHKTPTSSSQAYSAGVSDVAKPSLQGQEVLLALQKAAIEKSKLKQRTRKVSDRARKSKENAVLLDSEEWRDAKPIVVKPEWAHQIEDLQRRIENLKNPMPPS